MLPFRSSHCCSPQCRLPRTARYEGVNQLHRRCSHECVVPRESRRRVRSARAAGPTAKRKRSRCVTGSRDGVHHAARHARSKVSSARCERTRLTSEEPCYEAPVTGKQTSSKGCELRCMQVTRNGYSRCDSIAWCKRGSVANRASVGLQASRAADCSRPVARFTEDLLRTSVDCVAKHAHTVPFLNERSRVSRVAISASTPKGITVDKAS